MKSVKKVSLNKTKKYVLDCTPGDWIVILKSFDDGWAIGYNRKLMKTGMFPLVATLPLEKVMQSVVDGKKRSIILTNDDTGSLISRRSSLKYDKNRDSFMQESNLTTLIPDFPDTPHQSVDQSTSSILAGYSLYYDKIDSSLFSPKSASRISNIFSSLFKPTQPVAPPRKIVVPPQFGG